MAVIPQYELTQEMIDAAIETHKPLRLLYGVYNVSQTLRINQCCGLRVVGAGSFDPTNTGPGWSDLGRAIGTKILWAGGVGGPMFDLTSSMGVEFADCVLDGSGKATIGLGCWSVNGWPNSATKLIDVRLQNFTQAAVQFGTPSNPTGGNCDLSYFNGVTLSGCPVGIQVCNNQSVGHVWKRIYNVDCKIAMQFVQGGGVSINGGTQDGNQDGNTYLQLLNPAGQCNNAIFAVRGVHIESGLLLDASACGEWSGMGITLDSCIATSGTTAPVIAASTTGWPKIGSINCVFNGREVPASMRVI